MDQHYILSESAVPNFIEKPYAIYPNQSRPELDHRCQPFFVQGLGSNLELGLAIGNNPSRIFRCEKFAFKIGATGLKSRGACGEACQEKPF
jgi:hypothetical protein